MPNQDQKYDVAIVGGGPAGSSCGIRLARQGLKVLIVEQKRFPRPKLCGEFISPECLGHFHELGVSDQMAFSGGVHIEKTIFYARSGRSVTVPSEWLVPGLQALGLSRAKMDAVLLDRASEVGADVSDETSAIGLSTDPNGKATGLKLRDRSGRTVNIDADLLIDATGRSRALSKLADPTIKRQRADFVAFKTHVCDAAVPAEDCEIYSYRDGYGGSSRVEEGLNNMCFIIRATTAKRLGSDAGKILREVLFTNLQARRSLSDATVVDQWLAVPIEKYGRSLLSPMKGLIAVGDAAGFIDPFTGSGMLLAFESSRIAANVIAAEGSLDFASLLLEYQRSYRSAFDRRLGISSLVRKAAFVPLFADTVINFLSINKKLTKALAERTRHAA